MVVQSEPIVSILNEIESEHIALTKLLNGLSADQVSSHLDDDWSAIDVIVHITAWQDNALQIARSQAAPQAPALNPRSSPAGILRLNVQRFNDALFASHHDWTFDQEIGRASCRERV